jgi:hypothetical protein
VNPILDQIVVALIIAGAFAYLFAKGMRRRPREGKGACGGGCCAGEKKSPVVLPRSS